MGGTRWIRRLLGVDDIVDDGSLEYLGGSIVGTIHQVVLFDAAAADLALGPEESALQRLVRTLCFVAGTPVLTDQGEKPIEQIHAGDTVLSRDPVTGKQSYQRVERTFVNEADTILKIETEDGRSIESTPEHPFFVEGKGFIAAKKLARSDLLVDAKGGYHAIVSVTERHGKFTVYNFEVADTHTYYAGGWWVHNKCPRPGRFLPKPNQQALMDLAQEVSRLPVRRPSQPYVSADEATVLWEWAEELDVHHAFEPTGGTWNPFGTGPIPHIDIGPHHVAIPPGWSPP
jgi:hypothetical protein